MRFYAYHVHKDRGCKKIFRVINLKEYPNHRGYKKKNNCILATHPINYGGGDKKNDSKTKHLRAVGSHT